MKKESLVKQGKILKVLDHMPFFNFILSRNKKSKDIWVSLI